MKFISSRALERNLARGKRAARREPLIVTHRGRPAFVLTGYDRDRGRKPIRLTMFDLLHDGPTFDFDPLRIRDSSPDQNIADLLRQDEPGADFDFDPTRFPFSTPGKPEGLPRKP
ncbi:type II toxin-antitoxin system Phd/YefM family antitoxin [Labrys sp. KNU-23]|uniref:type II toxin-antitoxin system Phd/YefM family antitoxin n=1 Tax=Labrys sp. KNU-23 TaxID=2789216 RepID=UPI0011EC610D|nr:type II toxin-antitoxin system prevent-host-death family antitoxin [Labrys sp. KNU-23]QEN90321.1 type II toxin-antitoxin system Phd/YefM family antitoxin [Labrys sp. KNU-23]